MSENSFEAWSKKEYVPKHLKDDIVNSDILIIPQEGFREITDPLFPVGTEELFLFLKENAGKNVKVEVCISDEDYEELALHDGIYLLGAFIISELAKPMFVNLVYDYMKSKLSSRKKEENTEFKLTATSVKKDGSEEKIEFEGTIEDFKEVKKELDNS